MEIMCTSGRIKVFNCTTEERKRLMAVWDWKPRVSGEFNVEDTWANRIILGMPIVRTKYVAQNAVDGLLDFQRADVKKLATYGNMLNANYMGLGKTIESLAVMKTLGLNTAVIFTKKSCISQWEKTIHNWLPDMRVHCQVENGKRLPNLDNVDIVIANYEKIRGKARYRISTTGKKIKINTLSNFGEWLCGRLWDILILDEVHLVKNYEGVHHQLLKKIPTKITTGLSGTPITNRPDDLYGVLSIIEPKSVGGSYWTFVNYFCEIEDGFWGRKPIGLTNNPEKQAVFKKLIDSIIVRNKIEDVLPELPEISENLVLLDMEPKQRKVYKDVQKLLLDELPENCTIQNGMMKALRLQQVTTCPKLFEGLGWGPKFEFLGDWLEDEENLRMLIVSPYERHIHLLHDYLRSRDVSCVMYSGQLSDTRRNESLKQFKESGARVLCATIGAIGTGTDGLQHNCNTIVILDRSWGPEEIRQTISRLYRMGQTKKVRVFYLECSNSADQRIGKVVISKMQDIRKIVDGSFEDYDKNDYKLFRK